MSTSFHHALIAGGVAGTAVDTLFYPVDTLRSRAQSHQGFIKAGGFKGLYRGLGSAVAGSAPGASAFFTSYELIKDVLPRTSSAFRSPDMAPVVHMIAASSGEVAACMVRVPTEVVKQRSQTSSHGSWAVAKDVWSSSGLKGFYRGFGTTVAREIPFTCLQFPLYERLKLILARRRTKTGRVKDLPAIEAACCGSVAGGVAAGLTTPLDVAKTRVMLSGKGSSAASKQYPNSVAKVLRMVYVEEGLKALFSGVVPRICWISGGGMVFLGTYEAVKKLLDDEPAAAMHVD